MVIIHHLRRHFNRPAARRRGAVAKAGRKIMEITPALPSRRAAGAKAGQKFMETGPALPSRNFPGERDAAVPRLSFFVYRLSFVKDEGRKYVKPLTRFGTGRRLHLSDSAERCPKDGRKGGFGAGRDGQTTPPLRIPPVPWTTSFGNPRRFGRRLTSRRWFGRGHSPEDRCRSALRSQGCPIHSGAAVRVKKNERIRKAPGGCPGCVSLIFTLIFQTALRPTPYRTRRMHKVSRPRRSPDDRR